MELLGFIAFFCVGLILGMIGGGGSILSIPILVYLYSFGIVEATGYSLFIVGITSLVGSVQRYKDALVDFKVALVFGLPSILSKFWARKFIVPFIPEILYQSESLIITKRLFILGIFVLLVAVAAIFMIRNRTSTQSYDGKCNDCWLVLQGALIGLVTGIVGLGGGFIIVPTLLFFTRMPIHRAIGTALAIIAMNSLIGFTGDLFHMRVDWPFLSGITAIAVLGIFTGNLFSSQLSGLQLKKSFGWCVLILGFGILIKEMCCF